VAVVEPVQRKAPTVGEHSFGTESVLADGGWNTGGTGETVDFAWNAKAVLGAVMRQAKLARGGDSPPTSGQSSEKMQKGDESKHRGLGGIVLSHKQEDVMEEDERWEGVMGQQLEAMVEELAGEDQFFFHLGDDEEDVLRPVLGQVAALSAASVERVVGKESASSKDATQTGKEPRWQDGAPIVKAKYGEHQQALLEDAMSKVDAARDALSTVIATQEDMTLNGAAPEFVPGQAWQGSQRSCFVD
jgi:hypothetical protein